MQVDARKAVWVIYINRISSAAYLHAYTGDITVSDCEKRQADPLLGPVVVTSMKMRGPQLTEGAGRLRRDPERAPEIPLRVIPFLDNGNLRFYVLKRK